MPNSSLAILCLVASLGGCAATTGGAVSPRLVGEAGPLTIEVEGGGSVELVASEVACGAAVGDDRCDVDWERVADPVLVAHAEPGWRFDHWEAPRPAASAPSFSDPRRPRLYRAVFRHAVRETAKR